MITTAGAIWRRGNDDTVRGAKEEING